jgi:hypothetical protein
MTEYTKETYLAACAALWDKKPTEHLREGRFIPWNCHYVPTGAHIMQWRAVDPLREYKEAFEAGKRVEWQGVRGDWYVVTKTHEWADDTIQEYRIVEPKKVKLLPFAFKLKGNDGLWWIGVYFYESLEAAILAQGEYYHVAQILPDGSIEVDV